jgi:hypothetical protein
MEDQIYNILSQIIQPKPDQPWFAHPNADISEVVRNLVIGLFIYLISIEPEEAPPLTKLLVPKPKKKPRYPYC